MYTLLLSRKDIRFIKLLYNIASIIGIVPKYNFEKGTIDRPIFRKIYGAILILILSAGSVYGIIERLKHFEHVYTLMIWVLDFAREFNLIFMTLTLIFNCSFFDQNRWANLNNDFQELDKILNNRSRKEKCFLTNIYVQIIFYGLIYGAVLGYRVYIWKQHMGFEVINQSYLMHHIFFGYQFVINVLIINLAGAFKNRYQDFNHLLIQILSKSVKLGSAKKTTQSIREIGGHFRLLCEMVKIFNNMFGWTMIFSAGGGVVQLLSSFNYIVSELKTDNPSFRTGLIICNTLIGVVSVGMCSLVMFMCDKVMSASNETAVICYKLQDNYPEESRERSELLILANQTQVNQAKITAADFFDINRRTLLSIIGTTTTYVIIIIQFNATIN